MHRTNNGCYHQYQLSYSSPPPSPSTAPTVIRCVLVGDACLGKTSLIVAYTTNGFREHYTPTAFDNYSVTVMVDGRPLKLEIGDTAGCHEFHSLRPLSYVEANVFLLCFSVTRPASLRAVAERWLPELRTIAPDTPIVLVGTQSDLRLSAMSNTGYGGGGSVDPKVAERLAKQFGCDYIECSSITHHNLKEVFDLAILRGLANLSTAESDLSRREGGDDFTVPESRKLNYGITTPKKTTATTNGHGKLFFPAKKSVFAKKLSQDETIGRPTTNRAYMSSTTTPVNGKPSTASSPFFYSSTPFSSRTVPPTSPSSSLKESLRKFVSITRRLI